MAIFYILKSAFVWATGVVTLSLFATISQTNNKKINNSNFKIIPRTTFYKLQTFKTRKTSKQTQTSLKIYDILQKHIAIDSKSFNCWSLITLHDTILKAETTDNVSNKKKRRKKNFTDIRTPWCTPSESRKHHRWKHT